MADANYSKLNGLIEKLAKEEDKDKSLDIAVEVAGEVMHIIMPNDERGVKWGASLKYSEDALDEVIPVSSFPNQKVETWFEKHPYLGGERLALKHFKMDKVPFESKFYWLNRSATKARVTAGVMLSPNWEDSELTKYPDYKVGIDFFLSADTNSLQVAISDTGKLRVLELSGRLSNTQIDILRKIDGAGGFDGVGDLEPQRTIHKTLWDAFALKEVNKKFYEGIASHFTDLYQHLLSKEGGGRADNDAKQFANRLLGRLLFIWFLRKKGIIDESMDYFDSKSADATEYYQSLLKPLFFDTLNTPFKDRWMIFTKLDKKTPYLNGGLFDPHENDWTNETVSFPRSWFDSLYEHFDKFNFTTDESSPEYEQVAIDPEMLGRVFENLLAMQRTETGDQARKANGAFYTPREIVSYMCKESLRHYLYKALESDAWKDGVDKLLDMPDSEFQVKHSDAKKELFGKTNAKTIVPVVLKALDEIKVLDPACGSGAFPMGMLQLLLKTIERLDPAYDPYTMKLKILENNIYGVDIEPMAVELSRLRAWLSIVVDEKDVRNVKPLPNLDFKFVCANTLVPLPKKGGDGAQLQLVVGEDDYAEKELLRVRSEYFVETDKKMKEKLQSEYYYLQGTGTFFDRAKMIQKWHPFDAAISAPFYDNELMFGIKNGFDIVIGNPPYIHFEDIKELSKDLYKPLGYDTYEARGDIYALFYEKGMECLHDFGLLCYITSNKWMRAAYGQSLRRYFAGKTNPVRLIDFAGQQIFDATVDTNILLCSKEDNARSTQATIIKDAESVNNLSVYIRQNSSVNEFCTDDSWTVLSPIERSIKEKIEAVGTPLKEWDISINYGIKTGLNEAFIIDGTKKDEIIAKDPKSAEIIRPILRGRDIKRYGYEFADKYLIAVHNGYRNDSGNEVEPININDYPAIKAHLDEHWDIIRIRTDKGVTPYNLRNCAYMDDFSKQKIIYPNMTKFLPFYLDDESYMTNQKCFIITGINLAYLTAFLNSSIFKYCFARDFPDLMGETRELGKIYMEKIPVMKIDSATECLFFEKVIAVQNGRKMGIQTKPIEQEIDSLLFDLYRLSKEERAIIGFIEIQ
ncbi:hypothetical protein AGMMS49983_17390 [Clostridia bacterium]|nr:hypothetical protein AGMMS49983_17390 [Clostridia bacterium]